MSLDQDVCDELSGRRLESGSVIASFNLVQLVFCPCHPRLLAPRLLKILIVADLFHPLDDLAVFLLLNGDVRHGGCWRRAVPMLLAG